MTAAGVDMVGRRSLCFQRVYTVGMRSVESLPTVNQSGSPSEAMYAT